MNAPPSPPVSYSTTSTSYSNGNNNEGKRYKRRKDFQYKHGQRHHSYDSEKAPYPLSYDRKVLELESFDNTLAQYLQGSCSFAPLKEPPSRVLDLGCGTGTWVINAAKEWKDCDFVGFDLVDIQIPLKILDPSLARRIEWKHGNFLTTKLPFEDDEFDHIHIQGIALGVPENKWGVLFEEVSRVLRSGGTVEMIEEDALFPTLPLWFTTALRSKPLRAQSARFSSHTSTTAPSHSPEIMDLDTRPPHDHALLESLHQSVFQNRFINMKPSAVLPSYFTTYFRQVTLGPLLSFPMPPIAPLQPLPPQIITSYVVEPNSDNHELGSKSQLSESKVPALRPVSMSFSSSVSGIAIHGESDIKPTRARTASAPLTFYPSNSSPFPETSHLKIAGSDDYVASPSHHYTVENSITESEAVILAPALLFPKNRLDSLSERSLAMHLYRTNQAVLACQEAMWEELKDRIRNRKEELIPFGWDDDVELEELQSRKKFERLIERYTSDMQARVALWHSLNTMGWPLPMREPLSKAELIEEERVRESMMEARKRSTLEELEIPCRSIRVLIGSNL
ncbi:Demethylmenaquinone methyltransferase [Psilocybe cubensis]|uniref:Demethylmenaquinone methyltransferase n=2 Tax=Psilocybe cubensis TaxID=181762 RepID=A0ACB8HFQ5_PSICU|nr:Demethylmenaquinone methyltransferase [Psilocybe cubensis]KAH9486492.1 Demethylmenaquinone methyltransferase [Psilocybe cubensis]